MLIIELGAAFFGLAILARVANRLGFSPIPLYLIAGLCFGNGGLAPLNLSESFIDVGGDIGVLLLLFMLGLEYSGQELKDNLKSGALSGVLDFGLNFTPGLILGLILGWPIMAAVLLGGVTWVSSSGIIAKVLTDLKRQSLPETKTVMSILVLEDLTMALYLPLVGVLMAGGDIEHMVVSVAIALTTVLAVLFFVIRFGDHVSKLLGGRSDEITLLTTFGIVLLVAGVAERLQVSAAIGAFLVGIAFSGPIAKQSHRLFEPLRDLFAACFFFFFGLSVDPHTLPPVLGVAVALGIVTALTKMATGWIASKHTAQDNRGRWRAGIDLISRGEFSIVIAGLGQDAYPQLGPLAAAYVLFLAVMGPIVARLIR